MKKEQKSPEPFYSLGTHLITLGVALQDPETTLADLILFASRAGLEAKLKMLPIEQLWSKPPEDV